MNNKKKTLTALSGLSLFFATFLCWALLELIWIVSIDDVMYGGWTQHGFKYFIEKNIWHYNNFNGRFFVHLALQFVLFFEEHLYAIIFPFFISGSTYLFTTIAKKDWDVSKRLFASAISLLVYISLGPKILTSTAFWVAGAFNYVFPLIIVITFYWLFSKHRHKNIAMLYLIPFAFICGATTEQYGMYTIGLIVMTYFFDTIEKKKFDFRALAYLGIAISGLLTIMLAPPTLYRINISKRPLLQGLVYNWSFLGGKLSTVIIPILFMLFVGLIALCKKTKTDENGEKIKYRPYNPLLICGIPFAIIAGIFCLLNNYTVSLYLTFIYVVLAATTMLIKKETRELGKILVCGFGTFFMVSVSSIAAHRTCVPCILSFIIVLTVMFIDVISEANKKILCGITASALSTVCIFGYITSYVNYKKESKFAHEVYIQYKNSPETGVIEIDWDKSYFMTDMSYRNKTMTDMYPFNPLQYFNVKYNIPDNVKYIIKSDVYTVHNISCDGNYSYIPAIEKDGLIFLPVTFPHIKELMSKEFFAIMLYDQKGNCVGIRMNGKDLYCPRYDILEINGIYFVRLDYVLKQWNYNCTFDAVENTYIFTTRNK
ncbi:MAG: hypothetical protein E7678_07105 [Ruminococcaceae bacterium]|nr:hypothetical protein [Oscillospiraceae bacterium]